MTDRIPTDTEREVARGTNPTPGVLLLVIVLALGSIVGIVSGVLVIALLM